MTKSPAVAAASTAAAAEALSAERASPPAAGHKLKCVNGEPTSLAAVQLGNSADLDIEIAITLALKHRKSSAPHRRARVGENTLP